MPKIVLIILILAICLCTIAISYASSTEFDITTHTIECDINDSKLICKVKRIHYE